MTFYLRNGRGVVVESKYGWIVVDLARKNGTTTKIRNHTTR